MSDSPAPSRPELQRLLSWPDGVAIFVGIIVGSGIFVTPAVVSGASSWLPGSLLFWVLGGFVAGCGALCYAECGARVPRSGGFFVIYREAFGEPLAFVAGWTALLVTYPASLAAICLVFASYLSELFPALEPAQPLLAGGVILASGLLNGLGVRLGALGLRVLTSTKALALFVLCLAALSSAGGSETVASTSFSDWSINGAALATAAAFIMFTFDGWSDVTLVSGELRRPARDLGRTVVVGVGVVVLLYVLVQLSVGLLLPAEVAANSSRVLTDAVRVAFGDKASSLVAALVVVSTGSAIHAIVMTQSRIAYAMARNRVFPSWFGEVDPRFLTPVRSLAAVVLVGCAYVFAGDFADLVNVFTFAVWIFYGLTAIALLRLRRRGLGEPLEWKAPAGFLPPLVVLLAGAAMTWSIVTYEPTKALHGALGLGAGFVVYFIWRSLRGSPSGVS